jgi:hypothetical protein
MREKDWGSVVDGLKLKSFLACWRLDRVSCFVVIREANDLPIVLKTSGLNDIYRSDAIS